VTSSGDILPRAARTFPRKQAEWAVANPLQPTTTGIEPGGTAMGIWGRRVVAIDDDVETLLRLEPALRERGGELVSADQPGAALATILGVLPDVVLVDVGMRGLDGLGLIRKLRSLSPERGGRIPAATFTRVSAGGDDLERWRAAGFQRHLAKPVAVPAFLQLVDDLAGLSVERRAGAADRRVWPTRRDRRVEFRIELTAGSNLRGVAGGDERVLRELALADGGELG
jgi:CheY-like chemotaxis protein